MRLDPAPHEKRTSPATQPTTRRMYGLHLAVPTESLLQRRMYGIHLAVLGNRSVHSYSHQILYVDRMEEVGGRSDGRDDRMEGRHPHCSFGFGLLYERARSESRACRDACGARVDRWMKTTKKGQRVSAVCPTPYTPESVLSEWWLTK